MIDLRAARANPDAFRAAVARKGAGEAFDRLLEADAVWRDLTGRPHFVYDAEPIAGLTG